MIANPSHDLKQPGASRDTILEVAEELLAANGYAGTSISMICRRAGLPASSVYWHFGSKERILDEVLERVTERVLASVPRAELGSARPQQRIEELLLACIAEPGSERAVAFRLLTLVGFERGHARGRSFTPPVRRLRRELLLAWKSVFSQFDLGVPDAEADAAAETLARFAVAAVDGISFALQVDPELEASELARMAAAAFNALAIVSLSESNDAA